MAIKRLSRQGESPGLSFVPLSTHSLQSEIGEVKVNREQRDLLVQEILRENTDVVR